MSKTYYLSFQVVPNQEGLVDPRIEGGFAHCWVVEDDPVSATVKATYHVNKCGWEIKAQESHPIVVAFEDFRDRDLGEKAFLEAQEFGISTCIAAHTRIKELQTEDPVRQAPKKEFNMQEFLQTQQAVREQGQCLHYEKTDKCHEIIDAHSIQKNGALSIIARDGHVYAITNKFTDVKRNKGKLVLAKAHINSMSTFRGLCQFHDNVLFRAIDTKNLQPTDEQVFLYAYRSILRERFAKECSVQILNDHLVGFKGTAATKELLKGIREGNRLGLDNLKAQQSDFDKSHKEGTFCDIRYVMFESVQPPTSVFSGLMYPDWGFNGEFIQKMGSRANFLSLITFSFAPTDNGWAFLFAWHKTSDAICRHFISTLQAAVKANRRIEDLLFGLVAKGCENTAFCPRWLERRTIKERQHLEEALNHGADMLKLTLPNYLQAGINNIHEWQFDTVLDNLQVHPISERGTGS